MKTRYFVDTNIWLYAIDVVGSPEKSRVATETLSQLAKDGTGVISVQVQGEFASICTRKLKMSGSDVRDLLIEMSEFTVATHNLDTIQFALGAMDRSSVSFWDALMLLTAKNAGCDVLLTEDLNHGQIIEGIRIHNPFLQMPKV